MTLQRYQLSATVNLVVGYREIDELCVDSVDYTGIQAISGVAVGFDDDEHPSFNIYGRPTLAVFVVDQIEVAVSSCGSAHASDFAIHPHILELSFQHVVHVGYQLTDASSITERFSGEVELGVVGHAG